MRGELLLVLREAAQKKKKKLSACYKKVLLRVRVHDDHLHEYDDTENPDRGKRQDRVDSIGGDVLEEADRKEEAAHVHKNPCKERGQRCEYSKDTNRRQQREEEKYGETTCELFFIEI